MDLVTGAAVIVGLKYVGQPTRRAGKGLPRQDADAYRRGRGQVLADPIVEWRRRRIEQGDQLLKRAAAIVADMGQEPRFVPGRLLWPALEKGSVEEDPDLSERWAALLANASMHSTTVLPAFVTILSELSPLEAKLLSHVYAVAIEIDHVQNQPSGLGHFKRVSDLEEEFKLSRVAIYLDTDEPTVALLCDNLERLALIGPTVDPDSDLVTVSGRYWTAEPSIGVAFMEACSTPRPAQTVSLPKQRFDWVNVEPP